MRETPRRALRAGRVGRPHGLDGSFHVADPVPGLLDVGTTVTVGESELVITRRAGTELRPIVRVAGVEDRAAVRSLQGRELQVTRDRVPELEPDEWWAEDLEGCAVRDGGRHVGTVRRLRALPSCEVLEVERDGDEAELLVPLVGDAVRDVDIERREIDIDLRFLGEQ